MRVSAYWGWRRSRGGWWALHGHWDWRWCLRDARYGNGSERCLRTATQRASIMLSLSEGGSSRRRRRNSGRRESVLTGSPQASCFSRSVRLVSHRIAEPIVQPFMTKKAVSHLNHAFMSSFLPLEPDGSLYKRSQGSIIGSARPSGAQVLLTQHGQIRWQSVQQERCACQLASRQHVFAPDGDPDRACNKA